MNAGNLISFNKTKEKAESLKYQRIIKTNIVHVHGFPKKIAKTELLNSELYFGQYGKIIRSMIIYKINPENGKKSYSAYITYSNEKEAAFAILCVDSLFIEGKIIRAFFGTSKYCNYFLNNSECPNVKNCFFLHRFPNNNDIIIDTNNNFTYNQHLILAKKIIDVSSKETINFIKGMKKPKKNHIFPFVDFILLNEEEKENYNFTEGISYIKTNNDNYIKTMYSNYDAIIKNNLLNDNIKNIHCKYIYNDKLSFIKNINNIDNITPNIPFFFHKKQIINQFETQFELNKILENSIKHILFAKPYFNKFDRLSLKKLEFEYLQKDLSKKGINCINLFDGCLDCCNDLLFEK